jgi:hypothetical protein
MYHLLKHYTSEAEVELLKTGKLGTEHFNSPEIKALKVFKQILMSTECLWVFFISFSLFYIEITI